MTPWSASLRAYLRDRSLRPVDVARQLRVVPSRVHYWLLGSTPRLNMRKRIEKWSRGAVPAELELHEDGVGTAGAATHPDPLTG
jgi:hypothetical protein